MLVVVMRSASQAISLICMVSAWLKSVASLCSSLITEGFSWGAESCINVGIGGLSEARESERLWALVKFDALQSFGVIGAGWRLHIARTSWSSRIFRARG